MRKVGLAALEQSRLSREQYQNVGGTLASEEAAQLKKRISDLQALLEEYGQQRYQEIRESAELRSEFGKLCARFGVLNIKKTKNSLGSIISSNSGSNNYGLAVRIIEICRDLREETGGIVPLRRIQTVLREENSIEVSTGKIERVIRKLEVLGPGLEVVTLANGVEVVRSVMHELNLDHATVLVACEALGFVSTELLASNLGWPALRCRYVIDDMVGAGLLWVDEQARTTEYWSTSCL